MISRVLFRIDGGSLPEIGMGHVVRCIALAKKLGEFHVESFFVMKDYKEGVQKVSNAGFKIQVIPKERDEIDRVIEAIETFHPEVVVIDKLNTEADYMRRVKKTGVVLVTMDDLGEGQKYADITINAIVGGGVSPFEGPKYVVLSEGKVTRKVIRKRCKSILISFGGYDHLGLTLRTMKALEDLNKDIDIIVAIGSAFRMQTELDEFLSNSKRCFIVKRDVDNFRELLANVDIAIISGGLTLFEALAAGTPCIVISQYNHQYQNALKYETEGGLINLGVGETISDRAIKEKVALLRDDVSLRRKLARASQELIDGEGLARVSNLIRFLGKEEWDTDCGYEFKTLHGRRG